MNAKAKKKSIFNNMLSQIVVQFVTLVAGILIPRFIILQYGSEINGLASSVGQIVNYAALLEAGLGTASIHALYAPLAQNDRKSINAICSSTRLFFNKVGIYFTLAVLAISVIYPFFAKGETEKFTIAILILVIASTNIFEYFIHAKYRVLLTADQRLYIIGYSRSIGLVLQTIVKLALIFVGANVILVYLVSSVVLLLRVIFVHIYVKKRYPWVNFFVEPDNAALSQRKALVWHQLAGLVVNNTSSIVISTAVPSGLSLASIFSVYSMVINNIYNLITGAFSNGVVASFGQAKSLYDEQKFHKMYRDYEFGYYIVAAVIYGAMASVLLPFIKLYTESADINYTNLSIALLFVTVGILNATRVPGSMLINAAGHFSQTKNRAIIEAVINVVFMIILVYPLKIEGVLIASILSFLYRVPDIILYVNKHILKSSPLLSIRRSIRMWICSAISALLISNCLMPPSIDSWLLWLLWGGISVVITAMITLLINLIAEKNVFVTFLSKILNKFKILLRRKKYDNR